ncbi:MAG: hypothetical protein EAX96_09155 [Candidatus Lokiarchaeota archaeon]|nr:hypothetical protein [Candidatus Lokiarchaeota archaeon]
MGRGKAVLGLISILIGEFLIFLFIQEMFILDVLQLFTPIPFMLQITNSMPYLIWIFLITGIALVGSGIYMMIRSKFPPKDSSSSSAYFSS